VQLATWRKGYNATYVKTCRKLHAINGKTAGAAEARTHNGIGVAETLKLTGTFGISKHHKPSVPFIDSGTVRTKSCLNDKCIRVCLPFLFYIYHRADRITCVSESVIFYLKDTRMQLKCQRV
jgi:hypothetical protein